jgi:hypothetical protein
MSDRNVKRVDDMTADFKNGRHFALDKHLVVPVLRRESICMVDDGDKYWLLAAAILDSIADDLALCGRAGWWREVPDEMTTKCDEAKALMREMHSEPVADLCELITRETRGNVRIGTGWIVKRAKTKLVHGLSGTLSSELVKQRIGYAGVPSAHWTKAAGIDLLWGMPKINTHPAEYQAERRRRILAAGYCMCGSRLAGEDETACAECRKAQSARAKTRQLSPCKRPKPPENMMPYKEWCVLKGKTLNLQPRTVATLVRTKRLPVPPVLKTNGRLWWVKKEVAV